MAGPGLWDGHLLAAASPARPRGAESPRRFPWLPVAAHCFPSPSKEGRSQPITRSPVPAVLHPHSCGLGGADLASGNSVAPVPQGCAQEMLCHVLSAQPSLCPLQKRLYQGMEQHVVLGCLWHRAR